MSDSQSFRSTVQLLVRAAAARGASVNEVARALRDTYGRAYRRADLLADVRAHREAARTTALAGFRDVRALIARAGVAVFSLSLILPTLVHGVTIGSGVIVAASTDQDTGSEISAVAVERISFPNARARLVTPEPTPEPTPAPTPPPPQPRAVAMPNGMSGVIVTASWYGPGFYGNRLPCWQWLQANGLPIQFQADTWGVAHKTLPCGTMLTLSHGGNVITVPVVDRGPYIAGRELDLSLRVRAALGCTDLCTVLMHIP